MDALETMCNILSSQLRDPSSTLLETPKSGENFEEMEVEFDEKVPNNEFVSEFGRFKEELSRLKKR